MEYCNESFYEGPYKELIENFIESKRSMGYIYDDNQSFEFRRIINYLSKYYDDRPIITKEIIDNFFVSEVPSTSSSKTYHAYKCRIRQLSLYIKNLGYDDIYVLPEKHDKVTTNFIPYIFTLDEITRIFKSLASTNYKHHEDLKYFYLTLFAILYGTGLRLNEALKLKISDIDKENKIFYVLEAKGNTSRLVPYNNSVAYWLDIYEEKCRKENDVYFFESPKKGVRSNPPLIVRFHDVILPNAEIDIHNCGRYKRLHDFRHTFATHSLDKMIKSGKDPFCALPYLSTYLGHKDIKSTEIYLRLTEEHFGEITSAGHYIYKDILGDDYE